MVLLAVSECELPASVRVYYLAGTQHAPGTLPVSDRTADGARVQHPLNVVDFRPAQRAALMNLDRWVRDAWRRFLVAVVNGSDHACWRATDATTQLGLLPPREQNRLLDSGQVTQLRG